MPKAKTPTQIKLNRGSWRGKAESKTAPSRVMGDWACPKHLKGEAKKFWDVYMPVLVGQGVISKQQLPVFEAMCECWKDYKESMKNCPLDYHTHVKLRQEFTKMAMQFGMTPATVANVTTANKEEPKSDKKYSIKFG